MPARFDLRYLGRDSRVHVMLSEPGMLPLEYGLRLLPDGTLRFLQDEPIRYFRGAS